jgi:hypothetical protein
MTIIKIFSRTHKYIYRVKISKDEILLKLTHCFNKKLFIIIEENEESTFLPFDFLKNCIIDVIEE